MLGRVARTNAFEVFFGDEILSSSCQKLRVFLLLHRYRGMAPILLATIYFEKLETLYPKNNLPALL